VKDVQVLSNARPCQALLPVFCLVLLGAGGASPAAALEKYVGTSWAHEDGLPSTLIYAITQTRDGYLWLGTSDGLVRFDGINFVPRRLVSKADLPLGAITALCAAKSGLWIGAASGLIARVRGTDLQKVHLGAGIEAIVEAPEGDVWVVAQNEVYRFGTISSGDLVPSEKIDPVQITRLLASSKGGIMLGRRAIPTAIESPAIQTRKVLLGGRGLFLNKGKDRKSWLASGSVVQAGRFPVVLRDTRGYLWAGGSTEGLVRTTGAGRNLETELANDFVESLFEDREGDIWAGTNNGLYRFRFGKVFSLTKRDGLPSSEAASVETSGPAVWVGTKAGLSRIEGLRVQQFLRGLDVLSLRATGNHKIWVGTTRGVFEIGGREKSPTIKPVTTKLSSVVAIEDDTAGCVWLADAEKGLYRWKNGALTDLGRELGLGARKITTIRSQTDGTLWIGFFGGGLGFYKEGAFHELSSADRPLAGTVNDVYVQDHSAVWFGTDSGLYRFDGKKFVNWDIEQGLPGNRVLWLQADGENNFWLGFSTGIARIHRSDLRDIDPIFSRKVQCDFYDAGDGLFANPVRQSQSAASMNSEGKLWLTTSSGVATIDSRHIEKNVLPPPVVIERVIADNREAPIGREMRFPPLTQNLQIDYAGLSLVVPRKVQFRYRLEGYDKEWQNAGTRRQAFYTNLEPGGYRFRVLAANNDGVWNQDGASIDFSILPAFYQTRLFELLCFAAAAAIAWSLYRLRLRQMQAAWQTRFEERLAERTRLAQDLHDELLQNAMGVSLQLEATDSLIEETHAAKRHLLHALDLSRALMQQGREVLRDLRAKSRDAADITRVLSRTIEESQQQGEPASSLIVEGAPRGLNPLVAEDFVQIGRQAIANAFRHAAAKKIEVCLIYGATELCLEVRDDGRGIDPRIAEAGKPGHFGLIGMRERAERIGGMLSIASRAGEGTKVTVTVPAKRAFHEA
jgi:signal transduction histidine kinase/ligand-binding sensor domain-containing protein